MYVASYFSELQCMSVTLPKYILGNNKTAICFHWLAERRDSKPDEALDGNRPFNTYIFGAAQGSLSELC